MNLRGIVLEEGRLTICRPDGAPMHIQPLLTVVNANLMDGRLPVAPNNGNDQRLNAMRPLDVAPVPETLLLVVFIFLHNDCFARAQSREVCYARQVMEFNERSLHM